MDNVLGGPTPVFTKRLSWSAILSGAVVAVGLNFLLGLFNQAIGISSFKLTTDGAIVLATGGVLGLIIGISTTMITAGYVTGYLGRNFCSLENVGVLYGFLTWCLALALSAILVNPLANYATYFSNTTSRSVFVVNSENNKSAEPVTVETLPSSMDDNHKVIKVTATNNSLTLSAFTLFGLFLIGAFASCIGAFLGMRCINKSHN